MVSAFLIPPLWQRGERCGTNFLIPLFFEEGEFKGDMDFLERFWHIFIHYCQELWLILAVGFLISGIIQQFVPSRIVEKHLGEKGLRPILISSVVGAILPVCCFGSLPIAITFRKKGASLGAVMAFLVATPATSVSALIVCWKLLGFVFTVYIFFAVVVMALVMGVVCNGIRIQTQQISSPDIQDCCGNGCSHPEHRAFLAKMKDALRYAYITLPKEIGREILLGIALASFIVSFGPVQHFIREFLTGPVGYLFILIFGLLDYVCSTASVPTADALIKSGMSHGQALCYLLVGPITSYGALLVIKKDFGGRILWIYLAIISVLSLLFGIIYDIFI
jgi:uncharacterized membrane protein YraQ (UPF0718 family)